MNSEANNNKENLTEMKLIFRYETSDGCIHTTEEAARKYCEEKRGEILVRHSRRLCQENYWRS